MLPSLLSNLLGLCFNVQKVPWDSAEPVCISDQYYRGKQ